MVIFKIAITPMLRQVYSSTARTEVLISLKIPRKVNEHMTNKKNCLAIIVRIRTSGVNL